MFYSGLQIIKMNQHSQDEPGFVLMDNPNRGGAFCRYWAMDGSRELRNKANSEFTPYEYLTIQSSRHQGYVDTICGNLITFKEPEITGLETLEPGQKVILYNESGAAQNPLDRSYKIPIHTQTNGHYELFPPYTQARFFVIAVVGYSHDFAAYSGFISMEMPLDQGINIIARSGDKISHRQAFNLIEDRKLINLKNLSYRG